MIKTHLIRVLIGCTLGLGCATAYWRTQPRVYEASTQVFINSSTNRSLEEMSALLSLGISQSVNTEAAFMKSSGAFKEAIFNVAQRRNDPSLASPENIDALYAMYDIGAMANSRVMSTVVRAYDPQVAADISNELVDVYNKKRKQSSSSSYTNAQFTINQQLTETKKKLDAAEQRLAEFKQQLGGTDLAAKVGQITTYQNTLSQQLDSAKQEEATLLKTMDALKINIAKLPEKVEVEMSRIKNPVLNQIEMEIAGYEKQRTDLLLLYTPTSSKIKQIDGLIAAAKSRQLIQQKDLYQKANQTFQMEPNRLSFESQLAQSTISLVSLRARQRSLEKEYQRQSALAAALPTKERHLAELSRDMDIFQANYRRLKGNLTELQLQSATSYLPAVVLYPAEANARPISPQPGKILPVGFIMGGILGLLIGFLRESLRTTARTSDEVSSLFELPVVATVPSLPEATIRRNLQSLAKRTHIPQESFRFMASAAALAHGGHRRVIFTSSGGNVGCSSAAGEFAVAAAKMGIQTILIDADTTFGTITRAFKMTDKPGLRDILGRRLLATEDVPLAHSTEHAHLSVLPIGGENDSTELTDTPKALLMGLLESLQAQADLIVIDCPPIDVVADTSRFVPMVDEVCLVVSARKTSLQSISLARALLDRCGAQTVSVVLTGAEPKEEAFTGPNRYSAARR